MSEFGGRSSVCDCGRDGENVMEAWHSLNTGLFLTCFLLSIVSALVPWVNGEAIMLSLAALARSPEDLAALVLLASTGQMAGKCGLYWAGRGSLPRWSGRISAKLASWRERFEQSPSKPLALVFISSAVGIPPFYVITILAGTFRVPFGRFVGVGMCGRLVRFSFVALVPQLAFRWIHS